MELQANCVQCAGLCCVAPGFAASADFAIDKPAGRPCPNLDPVFRCGIHDRLRERGFSGCVVYDCFGAGQRVTQEVYNGGDWRDRPEIATDMFAAFGVMRQLHELLWYLTEAQTLAPARSLWPQAQSAYSATITLTNASPADLLTLDVGAHRDEVNVLLRQVSEAVRGDARHPAIDAKRGDLIGASLRGLSLIGVNLRGARLLGADLRDCDLTRADVTGADLRASDVRGANLTEAIFLTPSQLDAAIGDERTRLPIARTRPQHWSVRSDASR